jgi:hypothetical protein
MKKYEIEKRKQVMEELTSQRHWFTPEENECFTHLLYLMSENNKNAEDALPKPMEDSRFWNIVQEAGWGTVDFNFNRIKTYFKARMDKAEASTFLEAYEKKCDALATEVELYLKRCRRQEIPHRLPFSGDDGFGDMIAHTVGLGRQFYDKVMRDVDALRGLNVEESFSYCVPYPSDYEQKTTA